jgi:ubiquinone/menaquinone biosynthesis C-methylase UbiE
MIWRFQRLGRYWKNLAIGDRFGAILTDAHGGYPDWRTEEFFETGKHDAARFLADLERIAPTAGRGRLLDFGCGVGRVTRALAEHFESVVGMDIAPAMIAQARALNGAHTRCRFVVSGRAHLRRFRTGNFDVVYSRLVLQHVPPRLVRAYIREFLRVLAPGGALMFQLPDQICVEPQEIFVNAPVVGGRLKQRLPRNVVRTWRHLKYWLIVDEPVKQMAKAMAMFGMPHDAVLSLIREAGGCVVAVIPDQSHGPSPQGYEYWVASR